MPWQEFEVTLGLRNLLALRSLNVPTPERAQALLKNCGFDIARPDHCRAFEQIFGEALFLIRHVLFTDAERARFVVPSELLQLDDPRRLLCLASQRTPRRRYVRLWACSILKVMNAVSNLEYSGKLRDIDEARKQIFGRIKRLLHTDSAHGSNFVAARHAGLDVRLHLVDLKEAKTRTSIALKLLHKPDSIVDEVFDYLGVRFVVPTQTEVPRLLRLLIEADIVIPYQVIGLRTRNNLINVKKAQRLLNFSSDLLSMGTLDPQEFNEMASRIPWSYSSSDEPTRKGAHGHNAHSSSYYRSVQLTVRHLVRTPNPAYLVLDSLSNQLRHYRGMEHEEDPLLAGMIPQEFARYFPIEIQIMDASSYDLSKFGPASHEQYKASQLKVVREKVLGGLLFLTEDKLATQDF